MISASAVSTATTSSLLRLPSLPLRFCICLPRSGCGRRPIAAFVALAMAGSSSSAESHRHTNRLASEHSPYLLQHAHNPVDWYPWGEEAFEKARKRNIPIFLSIGYSTCHWCHVMEVESFENEEIAKMLNDWFVSIKVDREERPDVDKVYMTYVSALYGGGGWPLSAFLSPNLKPLMGGTYFPPDDKYGRPGFKTILRKVKEAWETKREMLEKSGTIAIEQLSEALSSTANSSKISDELARVSLKRCSRQLASSYDPKFGGFGTAPKFPRPVEVYILLYESRKLMEEGRQSDANKNVEMVCHTLQCMARGGIHDHIGGGFHRYSVDEHWHVPHFEKMLYDHGQLANAYLDTFSITKDTYYSSVAHDILDYLRRDKIGDAGEIYSAEDADSAEYHGATTKKEGSFYIWTSQEIEEILGEHANLFKDHYYIKPSGNCDLSPMSDPHDEFKGKNVLIERKDAPSMASKWDKSIDEYNQILEECRKKLYDARSKRPRPHLDDKVIVSWNGLAISSFARASKVLKAEPKETQFYFPVMGCDPNEYLEVAEKAVSFIKSKLYDSTIHRLQHSFRNGPSKAPGFLDDYAFLISGLLDLYEFGGRTDWLSWAIELQATQDELFLDKQGGGYYNTPGEDPSILLRVKEDHDGAEPSGNSVSAINLIRLSSMVAGARSDNYRRTSEHLLAVFEKRLKDQSIAIPLMCCAAHMLTVPSRKQVVLVGDKSSSEFANMVTAVFTSYDPNRTVIQIDPNNSEEMEFWEHYNPNVAEMAKGTPKDEPVVAHVCQNFACSPPVTSADGLRILLAKTAPVASTA
ncbi:spermatogenesis-associated protein 20-like isoform X1 [Zingiber officinale]|uniref:spermatogenesis-associated protein 20-like isoform X1 n=2 Tax=Zingiber officinale TaxID=94328 RepID=UPI001C4A83CB|nr:spermatogenesis-associated protein 20-like isoform X1 [Zingiber officinale]